MRKAVLFTIFSLILASGTALADGIDGRLGFTGRAGALVHLQDDFISGSTATRTGLAAGGGLILGFGNNFAAEIEVSQAPSLDATEVGGSKKYEATLTDVAFGFQYRIAPDNRLVPYLGAGVDFIRGNLSQAGGPKFDLDWTEGGHVNAGFDYFITKGIAFTTDMRGVFAFAGDVKSGGIKVGDYHPTSFIGTVGIRLFLPEGVFN